MLYSNNSAIKNISDFSFNSSKNNGKAVYFYSNNVTYPTYTNEELNVTLKTALFIKRISRCTQKYDFFDFKKSSSMQWKRIDFDIQRYSFYSDAYADDVKIDVSMFNESEEMETFIPENVKVGNFYFNDEYVYAGDGFFYKTIDPSRMKMKPKENKYRKLLKFFDKFVNSSESETMDLLRDDCEDGDLRFKILIFNSSEISLIGYQKSPFHIIRNGTIGRLKSGHSSCRIVNGFIFDSHEIRISKLMMIFFDFLLILNVSYNTKELFANTLLISSITYLIRCNLLDYGVLKKQYGILAFIIYYSIYRFVL